MAGTLPIGRLIEIVGAHADTGADTDATIRWATALPASVRLAPPVQKLPRLEVGGDGAELAIIDELGRGGMGHVQLAHQKSLRREVALKRALPGDDDPIVHEVLVHEGVITGQLEHPNVVPVHLLGVDERERPVLVMKRVEGVPWKELIGAPDHPAWSDTKTWSDDRTLRHLEIFLDVCSAVHFAHARGLVHRDIKPTNVMLGRFREVYLLDWGIACSVGTSAYDHLGGTEGLPAYMAPEMVDPDGVIDERTDVFLLGATLHVALTGTRRHAGRRMMDIFNVAQCIAFACAGFVWILLPPPAGAIADRTGLA